MNIFFHYNTIKVLAIYAGFNDDEAETIAYASQYVDDAVMHKPIRLNKVPSNIDFCGRINGKIFDPVCTAHKGLMYLDTSLEALLKVYASFHFIPSFQDTPSDSRYLRVIKDSDFARSLMDDAIKFVLENNLDQRERTLVNLGVVLHSYADTWAHQYFSGFMDSINNDIEDLMLFNKTNKKWESCNLLDEFLFNVCLGIGHAEA